MLNPLGPEEKSRWVFVIEDFAELDHMLPVIRELDQAGFTIEAWLKIRPVRVTRARRLLLENHSVVKVIPMLRLGLLLECVVNALARFDHLPPKFIRKAQWVMDRIAEPRRRRARLFSGIPFGFQPMVDPFLRKVASWEKSGVTVIRLMARLVSRIAMTQQKSWKSISGVVWGWGEPDRYPFGFARHFDLPTVCVPHGFNIFATSSPKDGDLEAQRPQHFRRRNAFTAYVVNNDFTRHFLTSRGMDEVNLLTLGNLRLTREFNEILLTAQAEPRSDTTQQSSRPGRHVTLFLPNPDYRVDWASLRQTISLLSSRFPELIVVPHFRVGSGRDYLETIMWCERLACQNRVLMVQNEAPEVTISKSELVFFSGVSVGIIGLLLQKPTFHLDFLTANPTIFENLPGFHLESLNSLANIIQRPFGAVVEVQRPTAEDYAAWGARYVHGTGHPGTKWVQAFSRLS